MRQVVPQSTKLNKFILQVEVESFGLWAFHFQFALIKRMYVGMSVCV